MRLGVKLTAQNPIAPTDQNHGGFQRGSIFKSAKRGSVYSAVIAPKRIKQTLGLVALCFLCWSMLPTMASAATLYWSANANGKGPVTDANNPLNWSTTVNGDSPATAINLADDLRFDGTGPFHSADCQMTAALSCNSIISPVNGTYVGKFSDGGFTLTVGKDIIWHAGTLAMTGQLAMRPTTSGNIDVVSTQSLHDVTVSPSNTTSATLTIAADILIGGNLGITSSSGDLTVALLGRVSVAGALTINPHDTSVHLAINWQSAQSQLSVTGNAIISANNYPQISLSNVNLIVGGTLTMSAPLANLSVAGANIVCAGSTVDLGTITNSSGSLVLTLTRPVGAAPTMVTLDSSAWILNQSGGSDVQLGAVSNLSGLSIVSQTGFTLTSATGGKVLLPAGGAITRANQAGGPVATQVIATDLGLQPGTESITNDAPTGALKFTGHIAQVTTMAAGLSVGGVGATIFTGLSDYTGGLTVVGGTTAINGTLSSSQTLLSGTNATLAGSGTVQGISFAANATGVVAPSDPLSNSKVVFHAGSLNLTGSGTCGLRLRVSGFSTPGTDFDQMAVSGAVTLDSTGHSQLIIDVTGLSSPGVVTGAITYGSLSGSFNPANVVIIGGSGFAVQPIIDTVNSRINLNVTVAQQSQTINFPALPNVTYGIAPMTLTATASSGLPVAFSLMSGPAVVTGNQLTVSGTGTVTVRASQAGNSSFLAAAPVDLSFTVLPAALSITAVNATAVAGSPLPTLTATYSGFVNGDTQATLAGALVLSTAATSSSPPGSYAIVPSGQTSSLYTITYTPGTLVLTAPVAAAQIITFAPLPDVTYGIPPITLVATASSGLSVTFSVVSGPALVTSNQLTVSSTGTVTVRASQAGNASFLAATPVDRSFAVVPASLTITAVNATGVAGSPLPTLTATYSGFVNGDTQAVLGGTLVLNTTATVSSPPGSYSIVPGGLSSPLYAITYQSGTLVLTVPVQTAQTITFAPLADVTYGVAPFTLTATASSGLPILFTVVSGPATLSGATLSVVGTGTVTVRADQPGNSSFSAAPLVVRSFSAAPAALTVIANDQTRPFGASNPPLTASFSGFVLPDTPAVLTGTLALTTVASITSAPGMYAITPSGLTSTRYSMTYLPGSLTVTSAPALSRVTLTLPPLTVSGGSTIYNALCPSTSAGISSLLATFATTDRTKIRGFAWDSTAQVYVELPNQPSSGLQPYDGVFLATRVDLVGLDFSGVPSLIPFTIPLHPGWNFIGVPPLSDGASLVIDHSWDHLALVDQVGISIQDAPTFVAILGTPGGDLTSARPYSWNGSAYVQVTSLRTGVGYWIKNNGNKPYALVRTSGAWGPALRDQGATLAHDGAADSVTFHDRGKPPAPPADGSASSGGNGRGCGLGSAAALLGMLVLFALRKM